MKNPTVTQLRTAGWQVGVQHHRRWFYQPPKDVIIMRHEDAAALSQVREASSLPGPDAPGWRLAATGGRTEVRLVSPSGVNSYGVTECSRKENYNRRNGRECALGRALAHHKAQTGVTITRDLIVQSAVNTVSKTTSSSSVTQASSADKVEV